jgi:hypothetical protein
MTSAKKLLETVWQKRTQDGISKSIFGLQGIPQTQSCLLKICGHSSLGMSVRSSGTCIIDHRVTAGVRFQAGKNCLLPRVETRCRAFILAVQWIRLPLVRYVTPCNAGIIVSPPVTVLCLRVHACRKPNSRLPSDSNSSNLTPIS